MPKDDSMKLIERKACPVCGHREFTELHRTEFSDPWLTRFMTDYYSAADPRQMRQLLEGSSYVVRSCASCTLIYQVGIPSAELASILYNQWTIADDPLAPCAPARSSDDYSYLVGEVGALFEYQRRRIGSRRRLRVLDFGMGWGRWSMVARAFGAEVFGMETSEPKKAYARTLGVPVLEPHDLAHQQFDIVATEQVLEHVDSPIETARMLTNALDPGGILKVSVPPSTGIRRRVARWNWADSWTEGRRLMAIHPLEHLQCFTPASLDCMGNMLGLRRAKIGLSLAYTHSTGWTFPVGIARNLLRPIFRFTLKVGGYVLFARR
jgi:hypothetical protein